MDPERVLDEAIARLAPKMPAGVVFKRPECLARIRELQQTCNDATIIDEFVRVVSSEPEKYVEGTTAGHLSSSAPTGVQQDAMMPIERGQEAPVVSLVNRFKQTLTPESGYHPMEIPSANFPVQQNAPRVKERGLRGLFRRILKWLRLSS